MANDPNQTPIPEDLYPAPITGHVGSAAFTTPDQALANRKMAMMLLSHDKGGAQQDVHHWAQGLSNMANSLVGALLMNKTLGGENEQLERGASAFDLSKAAEPGGGIPAPQPSYGSQLIQGAKDLWHRAIGGAAPEAAALPPDASDMDHYKRAIASNEQDSRGYQTIGPVTRNGDRAYGKYQVMGNEIPGLTAKYLGHPMNIADFYHSPEAQEKVFEGEFGRLVSKYGPSGAARAWFAGEGGMNNPRANDGHWSVPQYNQHFMQNLANQGWRGPRPPGAAKVDASGNEVVDRSGGVPAQPATGAQPLSPAPAGTQTPATAQNAPAATPAPTRVASNDPTAGLGPMDKQLPMAQVLAATHPGGGAIVGPPPAAGPAGVQVAASRAAPGGQTPGPATAPAGAMGFSPPTGAPVPPELLPQRFRISPQQLHEAIRNPYVPWEQKQKMIEDYRLQFQPVQGPNAIGQTVIGSARPGGPQMTVAPFDKEKVKYGDYETPAYFRPEIGPNGRPIVTRSRPQSNDPAGQISGVPSQAVPAPSVPRLDLGPEPAAPASAAPPAGAGPAIATPPPAAAAPAPAPAAPAAPASREELLRKRLEELKGKKSEGEPAAAPVRTAALTPAAGGTMSDAPPPEAGPLSTPPPGTPAAAPAGSTPPPAAAAPAGPSTLKTAQSIIDPEDAAAYRWMQDQKYNQDMRIKEGEADIKNFNEAADANQKSMTAAHQLMPQLQEQEAIINDKRFPQGPGSDLINMKNAFLSFMGNKEATAAMDRVNAFNKNVSGAILNDMRGKLQGLGQVRVAEIELLKAAAASQGNTLAANRLIVDMAKKYQDQLIKIGQITNMYKQGVRWDVDGKQLPGVAGSNDRATSAGLNAAVNKYLENHPMYSKDEIYGNKEKGIPGLIDKFAEKPAEQPKHRRSMLEEAPPANA